MKYQLLNSLNQAQVPEDAIKLSPFVFTEWSLANLLTMQVVENEEDEPTPAPVSDKYGEYVIAFDAWDSFQQGLEQINNKAAKYGVPPLEVASKVKTIINRRGLEDLGWAITLKGKPVKINGWEFIASVEHSGTNGNALRFVPGMEDVRVKQYAKASDKNCDFCHSNRDRNNTYIVRNVENQELKQVGGQCLQKYIGDAARKMARFAFNMDGFIAGLDDGGDSGGGGGSRKQYTDVETALCCAIILVDEYGFIRTSELMSTSYVTSAALWNTGSREELQPYLGIIGYMQSPPPGIKKRAQEMIQWFNDLPEESKNSSYMMSLESILDSDMVSSRSLGLVCSLPSIYNRAMNEQIRKENTTPSEWVGTVGAKIPPTLVTVVNANMHDGNYGSYQLVQMKDEAGNDYTWFNTSSNHLDKGSKYNIVGKVKKHDDYKGKKTVLSHVKATSA